MKTIIIAALMALPCASQAADYSMVRIGGGDKNVIGTIMDETALAYDRNGYAPLDPYLGRRVSATVVYTSATLAAIAISSNAWTFNGTAITKIAHGLTTGVSVQYTLTAGQSPSPLVDGAGYFIIRNSANSFSLASSKANAVAGTAIAIGSATYSGAQTYTFTPAGITGTPAFKWQVSNDGTAWADLDTSSVTMSAYTAGGATSAWDFDTLNFTTLRLTVTGPTTGGIYIRAVVNLKE